MNKSDPFDFENAPKPPPPEKDIYIGKVIPDSTMIFRFGTSDFKISKEIRYDIGASGEDFGFES